ncbi:MAG: amino acid racemase [Anaerolineales bacterium]|nr:amino acid racemase [Anaerolineales bacterium]
MKIPGIIGGIAPESTIQYYRLMIEDFRRRKPDGTYPPILINSIDMKRMLDLIGANDLPGTAAYLAGEAGKLARAGAEFAFFASNTPHIVFEEVRRQASIPMLSIVEATGQAARALGMKRAGLFGTRFTMQARFYPDVFSQQGIQVIAPAPEEQGYIHGKYMGELVAGVFLPETRERMLAIAARMRGQDRIDCLILGGTELPLLLTDDGGLGIPFLDTTKIHAEAAVAEMLS